MNFATFQIQFKSFPRKRTVNRLKKKLELNRDFKFEMITWLAATKTVLIQIKSEFFALLVDAVNRSSEIQDFTQVIEGSEEQIIASQTALAFERLPKDDVVETALVLWQNPEFLPLPDEGFPEEEEKENVFAEKADSLPSTELTEEQKRFERFMSIDSGSAKAVPLTSVSEEDHLKAVEPSEEQKRFERFMKIGFGSSSNPRLEEVKKDFVQHYVPKGTYKRSGDHYHENLPFNGLEQIPDIGGNSPFKSPTVPGVFEKSENGIDKVSGQKKATARELLQEGDILGALDALDINTAERRADFLFLEMGFQQKAKTFKKNPDGSYQFDL